MVGVDEFRHGLTMQEGFSNFVARKSMSFSCISDPKDTFLRHIFIVNF